MSGSSSCCSRRRRRERTVLLVRHPPVALAWRKRCYGRSDMGWSRAGLAMARRLAEDLAAVRIDAIVHSGALRTARLAAMIARRSGVPGAG